MYPRRSSGRRDRKSTRLNSSHQIISYAVFCLKKKTHSLLVSTYITFINTHSFLYQETWNLIIMDFVRYQTVIVGSFACVFLFNETPTTEIYTLSLHDALPI